MGEIAGGGVCVCGWRRVRGVLSAKLMVELGGEPIVFLQVAKCDLIPSNVGETGRLIAQLPHDGEKTSDMECMLFTCRFSS